MQQMRRPWMTQPAGLMVLAMLTGVVGGLGAILFRLMIRWIQAGWGTAWHVMPKTPHWTIAALPAVGLLLVSLITRFFAREVKGHGVPQILEALALRGGRIRPRVGIFGILAPALTIGSGGSVGREGPIALIGGAFGSTLGQWLDLPDNAISILLACGSAAGIGATFNAPIAGGFFGLEVILGTYSMSAMVPVFLSSVVGVTVFTAVMGGGAVLATPEYRVVNHFAILFMLGLGVLGALAGYMYTYGLSSVETLFERLPVPYWAQALLGGGIVGALGLFWPQVLGVGYPTMHAALLGQLALPLVLTLLIVKYVATLVTIGAGGSGGVFAPSLFLGGMLGGTYGMLIHLWHPAWVPNPQIYAVAGMATMFAAAAQAPFVAITILLEITGDYHLTAPVIAAATVSYFLYSALTRDSMYTVKLRRRGVKILRGNDVRPIQSMPVRTALTQEGLTVRATDTVRAAYQLIGQSKSGLLPVLRDSGECFGVIGFDDLVRLIAENRWEDPIEQAVVPMPTTLNANTTIDEAARLLALQNVPAIPVGDETHPFIGLLTLQDVVQTYHRTTVHTIDMSAKVRDIRRSTGDAGTFLELHLPAASFMTGRSLKNLQLPNEIVVVSIIRDGVTLIPHGDTMLEPDDSVLVFCSPASRADYVRRFFQASASVGEEAN